ncbi:MAG: hypothetical protein ACLTYW_05180 [Collinsella sp.]
MPYGDIVDATPDAPTLTFNTIGRHQSRLVRTRISSNCPRGCRSAASTTPTPSPSATARAALSPMTKCSPS